MQAQFRGPNQSRLQLRMSLDDFLNSGRIALLARVNACAPQEVLLDHVTDDSSLDNDDDLKAAFAKACANVSGGVISEVTLDRADLQTVRREVLPWMRFWPANFNPASNPIPA